MREDYTDITFILDRSGSMSGLQADVIGGFNKFIEEQKKLDGKLAVTLIQFDYAYEVNYRGINVDKVIPLTTTTYQPRGSTALLDAVGRGINETGSRLRRMAVKDRPAKVLFVIYTDGQENSSREFTKERIREMIKHQEDTYSWQFAYLGANQDSFAEASMLYIPKASTGNWEANARGVEQVYATLNSSTTNYRNARAGQSFTIDNTSK